jgi:tRNA (guanine37-N1)-methyltransferase
VQIHLISAFPNMFAGPLSESMMQRARDRRIVDIHIHDLRDFTGDKHRSVDDYPYGGGPGMILKPEPIVRCVERIQAPWGETPARVILMSPQGETFTQVKANALSQEPALIFICGHYKGTDERVRELLAAEEISIGDYVLTGGELPAMVVIDAVVRLLPGVLGDLDSASGDSFQGELLDHPHYTRPEDFRGHRVPEVLLSGHHERIRQWREKKSRERTAAREPQATPQNHKNKTSASAVEDDDKNRRYDNE